MKRATLTMTLLAWLWVGAWLSPLTLKAQAGDGRVPNAPATQPPAARPGDPGLGLPPADATHKPLPRLSGTGAEAADAGVEPPLTAEDLGALLTTATLSTQPQPRDDLDVALAVQSLMARAPVGFLEAHHDAVHAIGWTDPANNYPLLLKAGTTWEQRQRLRREFGVTDNFLMAKYGDGRDIEIFVAELRAAWTAGTAQGELRNDLLSRLAELDVTRGGPLTAFFVECLNSPAVYPYEETQYVSLAYLALREFVQQRRRAGAQAPLIEEMLEAPLVHPDNPAESAEHQALLRHLAKELARGYGWAVSFRTPYLIAGVATVSASYPPRMKHRAPPPAIPTTMEEWGGLVKSAGRVVDLKMSDPAYYAVRKAVQQLHEAPDGVLQHYHDEVHRIGWSDPGVYEVLLLRAGTTEEERKRLRALRVGDHYALARYGGAQDIEIYCRLLREDIAHFVEDHAGAADEPSLVDEWFGLRPLVDLDVTRGGPVTKLFLECLTAPQTLPYQRGGRVSLAYLALEALAIQGYHAGDRELWLLLDGRARIDNPEDPRAQMTHHNHMVEVGKYLAQRYGWRITFRAPYLIGGKSKAKWGG